MDMMSLFVKDSDGGDGGTRTWQNGASNKFSYARQAVSACSYFMHDQLRLGWANASSLHRAGRIAFQLTKRTTHPSTHVLGLFRQPWRGQRYHNDTKGEGRTDELGAVKLRLDAPQDAIAPHAPIRVQVIGPIKWIIDFIYVAQARNPRQTTY